MSKLISHYGSPYSRSELRDELRGLLDNQLGARGLEISPLDNPFLRGDGVYYFDVLPTEELRAKALNDGRNANNVPDIHFHHPSGDLSIINCKFDIVFSAHCVEHIPDFVNHFIAVKGLLNEGGKYHFYVPNKRYTFDYYKPLTQVEEIVEAHNLKACKPSLTQFLRHFLYRGTHNDRSRHWGGDHGENPYQKGLERMSELVKCYNNSKGYLDLHCWIFTPDSFISILESLRLSGLLSFADLEVHETLPGDNAFLVTVIF